METRSISTRVCQSALAAVCFGTLSSTAVAEDFYQGKTISIIISGGGTFDSYARLLSRFMPKFVPGSPAMIVKAMPGASGVRASNYMYNAAAKDGTEIAGVHGQIISQPLFSRDGVHYDPAKFQWIGNVTSGLYVGYTWHSAKVQSMEDLLTTEAVVGGQSLGAFPVDIALLSNKMAGTRLRVVSGYSGAAEAKLAVERGELDGEFGTLYAAIGMTKPSWLLDKKINVIVQMGPRRHSRLAHVPLLTDFVKDPVDRAAMDLYLARQITDKPYLAPPQVPADRIAVLRDSFARALKDSGFLAEAEKMGLEVADPMTGAELSAFVVEVGKSSPELAKRVNEVFSAFSKP